MIKLFVADIDGTLLNEKSKLEEETIEAVLLFQKLGGKFMLATGRNVWEIGEITSRIPATINNCVSGCVLYEADGKEIVSSFMDGKDIDALLRHKHIRSEITHFHGDRMTYLLQRKEDVLNKAGSFLSRHMSLAEAKKLLQKFYDGPYSKFECSTDEIRKNPITKVEMLYIDPEEFSVVADLFRKEFAHCNVVVGSFMNNIEITSSLSDKGLSIRKYCQLKGIREDEVVVIGDSENDISMLEQFKYSYAMGNASEKVKEAANYVADDNRHLGVAKLLKQICEEMIWNVE